MDQRPQLIPAPAWALADAIDQAWTVVAAWIFGFSALIGIYMALTGLARTDAFHSLAAIPTAVLIVAAAVVDAHRPWTRPIGVAAGVSGAVVWIVALMGLPASDVGTSLPVIAFALVSLLCGRAFAPRPARVETPGETPAPPAEGWLEDVV